MHIELWLHTRFGTHDHLQTGEFGIGELDHEIQPFALQCAFENLLDFEPVFGIPAIPGDIHEAGEKPAKTLTPDE